VPASNTPADFSYSDGDEIEKRIFSQIQAAEDISLASDELQNLIQDWPSEYHFSSIRSNLLSYLHLKQFPRILEIGSGCGAITRLLGEKGKEVVALEGSYRRAQITRTRCRDLDNVQVYCDSFEKFETTAQYSLVTMIGVLEYSPAFFSDVNPIQAALSKAYNLLEENGVLVVAIENQLGLKYFNACSEDHTSEIFGGINDAYQAGGAITFGRKELTGILKNTGFAHLEFIYPFPDYKLPRLLIRDEALHCHDLNLGKLIGQFLSRDYSDHQQRLFLENRIWSIVERNELIPDLANSFLVFACKGDQALKNITDPWIMKSFSSTRKKKYLTENTFAFKNTSLIVEKDSAYPDQAPDGKISGTDVLIHHTGPAAFIYGIPYGQTMPHGLFHGDSFAQYLEYLLPWIQYLMDQQLDPSQTGSKEFSLLPGDFLDCRPDNLIITQGGKLEYFDREWEYKEPISSGFIIFRGILHDLLKNIYWYRKADLFGKKSLWEWLENLFEQLDLSEIIAQFDQYLENEVEFQSEVTLDSQDRLQQALNGFLSNRAERISSVDELLNSDSLLKNSAVQRESLEEHNKALEDHNQALEENNKVLEEHNKAWGEHSKALEEHNKVLEEHNKASEDHNKALEENNKVLEEHFKASEEHNKALEKHSKALEEHNGVLQDNILKIEKHNQVLQVHIQDFLDQNQDLQRQIQDVTKMIHDIWAGWSWKIGRTFTYIPRKTKLVIHWIIKQITTRIPRTIKDSYFDPYQVWYDKYAKLRVEDRENVKTKISQFLEKPVISIVMPTYNTPEKWLCQAIDSVRNQLYPFWELCIADDASSESNVGKILRKYEKLDSRIKVVYRKENGHISNASNSALALATGEFIALMDHDDELTEDALFYIVNEINQYPDTNLIYSDEDKIDEKNALSAPYFKPDWSPDLYLSHNFICHLVVFRKSILRELGGFRPGFEGAQDWDLGLRLIEKISPKQIRHIPRVLYHWRIIPGSTSLDVDEKKYAIEAGEKSLNEALSRRDIAAAAFYDEGRVAFRVKYTLHEEPFVSLIILTRDGLQVLEKCVTSILSKTEYSDYELIIVDNDSQKQETLDYLKQLEDAESRVRILSDKREFNFPGLNNQAVKQSKGKIIGLINNDIEVIDGDWLREMVSHAVRPEVGVVGARLLYPNDVLQHGGVITGLGGVAGHAFKMLPRNNPGLNRRATVIQNYSAVTAACAVMRREIFDEVHGMDEENLAVAFNDIDFCLRIREAGYLNVYTPYAELYHHESFSRGYEDTADKQARFSKEIDFMKKKWGDKLENDPYYNLNLTLDREDFSLSEPPRTDVPWNK